MKLNGQQKVDVSRETKQHGYLNIDVPGETKQNVQLNVNVPGDTKQNSRPTKLHISIYDDEFFLKEMS